MCPVSDAAYFLDASFRVAQHLNGNHTPVPGVPPPPPPPGGGFITWAWDGFTISDGSTDFNDAGLSEVETTLGIEDAAFQKGEIDIQVRTIDFEGDARLLWGEDAINIANAIQELEEGGYIVTGAVSLGDANGTDMYLVKLDEQGNVLWGKAYGTTGLQDGYTVQQTSDSGFVVLGRSIGGFGGNDICVIKTDQDGDVQWKQVYGGRESEIGRTIQQTSDNSYVIAGATSSFGTAVNGNSCIIKLDSTGGIVWSKTYGGDSTSMASSFQETLNGDYVMSGTARHSDQNILAAYLIKMDPTTGDVKWEKQYRHSNGSDAYSVVETFDGGYIMAGGKAGVTDGNAILIKTDSEGSMLWSKTYDAASTGKIVQETADGGYVLLGADYTPFRDNVLIKVDSDGEVGWSKVYGGDGTDESIYVRQTSDGGYVFAGSTNSFSASDYQWAMFTIKTDDEGNVHFDE